MELREPLLHALCFFPVNVVFSDSFAIEPKSYSYACLCPTPKNHLLENVDVTPAETQIGSYGSSTWNDVRITNAWKDNKWGLGRLWVSPTSRWADPSAQASPRTALRLSFLAFPSLSKCLFNYSLKMRYSLSLNDNKQYINFVNFYCMSISLKIDK